MLKRAHRLPNRVSFAATHRRSRRCRVCTLACCARAATFVVGNLFGPFAQYWHKKYELVDTHHANNVHVQPLSPPAVNIDRAAQRGGDGGVLDPDQLLEAPLNEVFLFHGTTAATADVIVQHGFDERVASLHGLYGAGTYFANQSCKAAQYARDRGVKTLIVARVTLGDPYYATGHLAQHRRAPDRGAGWSKTGLTYDCVVANTSGSQAHRELIVYDHRQAYPEYVVRFRE